MRIISTSVQHQESPRQFTVISITIHHQLNKESFFKQSTNIILGFIWLKHQYYKFTQNKIINSIKYSNHWSQTKSRLQIHQFVLGNKILRIETCNWRWLYKEFYGKNVCRNAEIIILCPRDSQLFLRHHRQHLQNLQNSLNLITNLSRTKDN